MVHAANFSSTNQMGCSPPCLQSCWDLYVCVCFGEASSSVDGFSVIALSFPSTFLMLHISEGR